MRQVLLGRLKETSVCIFNLALFLHPNGNRPGLTNYGHICLLYVTFKMTNFQEYITTFIYYRPPTKLLEGNFFSRVCLSTCLFTRGDPMWPLACAGTPSPDMVPHCTGTPHSPQSEHGTSLYRDPSKVLTSGGCGQETGCELLSKLRFHAVELTHWLSVFWSFGVTCHLQIFLVYHRRFLILWIYWSDLRKATRQTQRKICVPWTLRPMGSRVGKFKRDIRFEWPW